ncbi:GNAT family N-acetyltransferase [Anianabacter salinae]|uniref:GNAT family N-acetyltransferase n=1 Tax=Anianabacter salinae TaxID=2851023 RepID=UPI00225DF857|nr:GNAT family N-acetyltransferase [Anianabacter salinae]MBV0910761.1 GNAT family N-acetyltransferase [Anianabacter salinae]
MTLTVGPGDPRDPQATALLRDSHALMQRLFAPEENHFLSLDALAGPDIRFFTARLGDTIVGTGALALRDGYGEVKSMFVADVARGKGAAAALLGAIEAEARALGLPLLRLETGDKLDSAHRLYARHGFAPRGPFGDYTANATSLFMEKPLT